MVDFPQPPLALMTLSTLIEDAARRELPAPERYLRSLPTVLHAGAAREGPLAGPSR